MVLAMYYMYYAERMKVGSPYGYYVKDSQDSSLNQMKNGNKKEQMVDQIDWANMSRGLNIANSRGYEPTIKMLREMEVAYAGDIVTDTRRYE